MQKSSMDYELAYAGRALCATCKNVKCAMLGIGMNTVCGSYETERKEAYTRPDKNAYYLGIAEAVAKRSTCLRRQYGAVIVQDGEDIIATGYNGAPRGEDNCSDLGECWRERNHIPHGERYEKCIIGDTRVRLLNGTSPTIKELVDSGVASVWLYSINRYGEIVPALATNIRSMGVRGDLCKVTFDDGTSMVCTVDHRIMLRDMSYKEAGRLSYGDSVMPYYGDLDHICNTWRERTEKPTKKERESWSKTCKTGRTECMDLVYYHFHPEDREKVRGKNSKYLIHHADGNHQNNNPDNLVLEERAFHTGHHAVGRGVPVHGLLRSQEVQRERIKNDPSFLEKKIAIGRRNMSANWANPEWRDRAIIRARENMKAGREKSNKNPVAIRNRSRAKALSGISYLFFLLGRKDITEAEYASIRSENIVRGKGGIKPPRIETILKYFSSVDEALTLARTYNHKVVSVEKVYESHEVFDLEVPEYHNFAIDLGNNSGVFIHNCKAVHAEQNAIISAARRGATVKGGKVYLVGIENGVKIDAKPCEICEKMVKNAGLKMWYEE